MAEHQIESITKGNQQAVLCCQFAPLLDSERFLEAAFSNTLTQLLNEASTCVHKLLTVLNTLSQRFCFVLHLIPFFSASVVVASRRDFAPVPVDCPAQFQGTALRAGSFMGRLVSLSGQKGIVFENQASLTAVP
jgi:hypothetical protein